LQSDKCDDEDDWEEPAWARDAHNKAKTRGYHSSRFGENLLPDELLKDFGEDSSAGSKARSRKEEIDDWEKKVESDGKGIDEDFGHGMHASAHGSGDKVKEKVTAKTHRNADGSVSRSVSASATATSSSRDKQK
jgi:hypothetical protein